MKHFFEVFFLLNAKKFIWKNDAFIQIKWNKKKIEKSFLSYILYIPMA